MNFLLGFILFGLTMAKTTADHRSKRFLIFPAAAPTRMQLIAGVGLPVDLQYESVTIGFVLKAEYYLPDNTTVVEHFLQEPFNPLTHPITGRRRRRDVDFGGKSQLSNNTIENERYNLDDNAESNSTTKDHYEKYDVEAIEIHEEGNGSSSIDDDSEYNDAGLNKEEDEEYSVEDYGLPSPNDFSTARWTLFKGIEYMAERKGLAGRPCLLRSICESSHTPFSYNSGILAELIHIIMTPSSSQDTINDHSHNEYLRAEELGRAGEPCGKIFPECTISVLDQISGIYENIVKIFG